MTRNSPARWARLYIGVGLALCALSNPTVSLPPANGQCEVDLSPTLVGGAAIGKAIATDGDVVVIGAPDSDVGVELGAGAAIVYRFDGTNWIEEATLTASDAEAGDEFGFSVTVSGDRVVVGAPKEDHAGAFAIGAAYVFSYDGTSWSEDVKLTASDEVTLQEFGRAIALDTDLLVVGAPRHDHSGLITPGAAYVYRFDGTTWVEEQKLVVGNAALGDIFGEAVDVDGDNIVVGAPGRDGSGGANYGAAYVWEFDGTTWNDVERLQPDGLATGDEYGSSVAIDGDTFVIGVPLDNVGLLTDSGSVWVYRAVGTDWVPQQILTAPDAAVFDQFGTAVDVSGGTIVAGAPRADVGATVDAGAVYVFRDRDLEWCYERRLEDAAPVAGELLGEALALGPDVVAAGVSGVAPGRALLLDRSPTIDTKLTNRHARIGESIAISITATGTAPLSYEWQKDGAAIPGETSADLTFSSIATSDAGEYSVTVTDDNGCVVSSNTMELRVSDPCEEEYAKIWAPDGNSSDALGQSICGDGDILVVGAPADDHSLLNNAGSAYVYRFDGTDWLFEQRLIASDADDNDRFGSAVAVSGSVIAVGAPLAFEGAAYVYRHDGTEWVEEAILQAADAAVTDEFGAAVAIDVDTILVGSPDDDYGIRVDAGSAYVFDYDGTSWSETQKLTASDARDDDQFGRAVSLRGPDLVVGAPFHDHSTDVDCGSAYVFELVGATWTSSGELLAGDRAAFDRLGESVSIDGDVVAAGAPLEDNSGLTNGAGSVYIFRKDPTWAEDEKLIPSDAPLNGRFGTSVHLDGSVLAVGNTQAVGFDSVYVLEDDGTSFLETRRIQAGNEFGESVWLFDDCLAIGVPDDNDLASDAGAAFVYRFALGPEITTPLENESVLVGEPVTFTIGVAGAGPYDYQWRRNGADIPGETSDTYSIAAATLADAGDIEVAIIAGDGSCSTAQSAVLFVSEPCDGDPTQKIWHPAPTSFTEFGTAIALDGSHAIVGVPDADADPIFNQGEAIVFELSAGEWVVDTELALTSPDSQDAFGTAVGISGDMLAVGAPSVDDGPDLNVGSVTVYRDDGTDWLFETTLTASNAVTNDFFGNSVAADTDLIVVGATGAGVGGAVYVYRYDGSVWSEEAILVASDIAAGDNFGRAIAVDGDTVVVGASGADGIAGGNTGALYVFDFDGTVWSESQILTASDAAANDLFGSSVDVEGTTIVGGAVAADPSAVNAAGAVYVFDDDGTTWSESQKLVASDLPVAGNFGHAVSLSSATLAISAPFFSNGGQLYVFELAGSWSESQILAPGDVAPGDWLGLSLALDADTLWAGSPQDDDNALLTSGSAYVFDLGLAFPTITAQPADTEACPGDDVTLTVVATGTGILGYQWRKDGVDLPGETTDALTLLGVDTTDIGSYDVVVTDDGADCPVTSDAADLTLAVEIVDLSLDTSLCAGEELLLAVDAIGSGPITYQWFLDGGLIGGAESQTYLVASASASDAGSYRCDVTVGACTIESAAVLVTVFAGPTIDIPPLDTVGCEDGEVTFTVDVTGVGPLTYQWRRSGIALVGETNATLTLTDLVDDDADFYDVIVTDANGCSATSEGAVLTIETPPGIETNPSDSTVCAGEPATFVVEAFGAAPLTYQWFHLGVAIPDATDTSYTIDATVVADAGLYFVEVTAPNGCTIASASALLTVDAGPEITGQPIGDTICIGDPIELAVVTGPGLSYQWRLDGVDLPFETLSSYSVLSAFARDAGDYDCVVTDPETGCSSVSFTATITILTAPAIETDPVGAEVCVGDTVELSVEAAGDALEFTWRLDGVAIPGETADTLTLSPIAAEDAGEYTVIVSNECGSVTSAIADVIVDEPVLILDSPMSATVCLGDEITLEVDADGTAPLSYQWEFNAAPIAGATDSMLDLTIVAADAGDYTCVVSNDCGSVTTPVATLTVEEAPVIDDVTFTADAIDPLTLTFTADVISDLPLTYDWEFGDMNTSSDAMPTHGYASGGVYTVMLTVTNDCGSASTTRTVTLGTLFERGDFDGNGSIFALIDVIFLLDWQFNFGPAPTCMDAVDADDSGTVFPLIEALYLLDWQFNAGPAPTTPGPGDCGTDPTLDALDCATPTCS